MCNNIKYMVQRSCSLLQGYCRRTYFNLLHMTSNLKRYTNPRLPYFTRCMQVHGRSNYELLYQVNQALELSALVPQQQRVAFQRQFHDMQ